jgi:Bacterial lectin/Domain of unknown function (DUF1929)
MNNGSWSAVMPWPLIGLHAALLPDGRVLTFGTDENGEQGGQKIYDIWDPKTGLHQTSTKATLTDEFCSAEILDPVTDRMLIIGGDARPQGNINTGVPDVNTFDYHTGNLTTSTTGYLNFPRWYPSLISLGSGQFLAIGGEGAAGGGVGGAGSGTPEVYTPGLGWKALPGAFSADIAQNWYYPRVWMSSNGTIFGFSAMVEGDNAGTLFTMTTPGVGSITNLGHTPFESEDYNPAAMFAPDKILTIDKNGNGWIMDISGATPTFTQTGGVGSNRAWSNLTVLADGTVLLTGGSVGPNNVATETNNAEIWNPATGQWTNDASAAIGRFYHSNTLLLPDGTVLSLGGGAPGPLTNLNAEVYTPGYLLNADGSLRTDRPVITDAPKTLQQGQTFTITVDNANAIQKLELIKYGNATHSFDAEQRPFSLAFTKLDATHLQVTIPGNANLITDGYWMLFADNQNGTPSVAATIKISQFGVDTAVPNIVGTNFMLNGTASHVYGSDAFTLTTDNAGQTGSVMSDKRIDLTHNFDLSFALSMGDKASPADGMAFVLHNDAFGNAALGKGGGGLGAGGLLNGLAIQFDTWQNANQGDIAAEHTDIVTTDPRQATYRLTDQVAINLTDGQKHQVHVSWDAASLTLTYTFDGVQVGQLQLTPQQYASYFGGSNYAYFGFTGSTGGASDLHQLWLNSVNATFETGSPPGAPHASDGSIFDVNGIGQHVTLNGSASYQDASHIFTLTPDATKQVAGGVTFNDKVDLNHDFNMMFDVYFGPNHRADGMTFVLHNDSNGVEALGNTGGKLGAIGMQNGLAIEFDTWQNASLNDPAYNHTAIIDTTAGADLTTPSDIGNITDGGWHQIGVRWDSQTHTLQYWVDGKLGGMLTGDIVNQYLGGQTTAYFGFTGATGAATDVQQVRVAAIDAYLSNISSAYANVQDPIALSNAAILNGSATYDSSHHTFVLTPDVVGQAGSAMLSHRIDLSYDFQASFDVYLGNNSNGADGLAFLLQNDPQGANAIGAAGGHYGAIQIRNGLGIAFDTYQNTALGDMVGDHTDFFNTGAPLETSRIGDQLPIGGGNVKDGQWHNVMVSWNASNHTLTYWFDGVEMNTLNENIVAKYLGGSQYAYLGFTGGTGGAHNLQEVHLDTLTGWFEGDAHNSATAMLANTVL